MSFGKFNINEHSEVEDVLALASLNSKDVSDKLRKAADEYGWLDLLDARKKNKVPMAEWSRVVVCYLEGGWADVAELLKRYEGNEQFVLGLVNQVNDESSVTFILDNFSRVLSDPSENHTLAEKLINVINELLSFSSKISLNTRDISCLRNFAHSYLLLELSDSQRAVAYCALRGVGNKKSIELVEKGEPLSGSWTGVESLVIKAIKKLG